MALALSVLDQSPIAEGPPAARRSATRVDLARLADALGYSRYWVAEHHGMPMLAEAAPEILIAEIAAVTERIRVGSGGVMLPALQPVQGGRDVQHPGRPVHGDRIDLGIGRAPGTDPQTMFALQRDRRERCPTTSPSSSPSCSPTSRTASPPGTSSRASPRCPGAPGHPRAVAARLLAAERDLGGQLGLPYSFADFINPRRRGDRRALPRALRAVATARAAATLSVGVAAICAETDEEAERLAASSRMTITLLRRGRLIPCRRSRRRCAFLERAGRIPGGSGRRVVVGTPETVRAGLEEVAAQYGADEVMVVTITYDHAARRRSYELIAEAFGLAA